MNRLTQGWFTAFIGIDWSNSKHDVCIHFSIRALARWLLGTQIPDCDCLFLAG